MTTKMIFSKKHFIIGTIIGLILLVSSFISFPDSKLHLIFCDVGQGDGAYIRAPNGMDMLIDGGPNDKVLSCLGKHMPFYDRTIDVVLLTHPQKDHMQGLISVIERYKVKYFIIGVEGNSTEGYKLLVKILKKKNIPIQNLYTGDKFTLGKVEFDVLWPEKKWVASHISPALNDLVYLSNSKVLGMNTDSDVNDFSYYIDLKYGVFSTLFTGDGDSKIQPDIMKVTDLPQVSILKFPHHGSKTGILPEFLDKLKPVIAVISVGKNSYGHPTKEALDLLNSRNIQIRRTDQEGDIEIVTDGKRQ